MTLDRKIIETLSAVTTATLTTILLKKGLRNVWMRGTRPDPERAAAAGGPRVHAPLRPGTRRPGNARIVVQADLDAGRHRGDAGRMHRRGRCHGRHRRRHLR